MFYETIDNKSSIKLFSDTLDTIIHTGKQKHFNNETYILVYQQKLPPFFGGYLFITWLTFYGQTYKSKWLKPLFLYLFRDAVYICGFSPSIEIKWQNIFIRKYNFLQVFFPQTGGSTNKVYIYILISFRRRFYNILRLFIALPFIKPFIPEYFIEII